MICRFLFSGLLILCIVNAGYSQKLRIATYQYATNTRVANIQPFADYLNEEHDMGAVVKSYPSVQELIEGIQEGEVDVALINSFGFMLLESSRIKYPMLPVLALSVPDEAKDNYKTTLVVRADSPIQSFENLEKFAKTTRLMLVAKGSTSGNLVPRLALGGIGIRNPENKFRSMNYAGNHQLAVQSLLNNEADAAFMGHTEYERVMNDSVNKNKIRLIWLSPEIPLGPVLFHNKIPDSMRVIIERSLLELHMKKPVVLESIKSGWSEAKQATHFARIEQDHYDSFHKSFGREKHLREILRQFAN